MSIDGQGVGNTPQRELPLLPGRHLLRVEHAGFRPYERLIDVAAGERLRVTDITLAPKTP